MLLNRLSNRLSSTPTSSSQYNLSATLGFGWIQTVLWPLTSTKQLVPATAFQGNSQHCRSTPLDVRKLLITSLWNILSKIDYGWFAYLPPASCHFSMLKSYITKENKITLFLLFTISTAYVFAKEYTTKFLHSFSSLSWVKHRHTCLSPAPYIFLVVAGSDQQPGTATEANSIRIYMINYLFIRCRHYFCYSSVKYPSQKVFIRYNTILPSLAPAERFFFSPAGLVETPWRNRLNDSMFEKLLLLKINKHWFNNWNNYNLIIFK